MRIFADTSGLFAAIVRNDVMHENAKRTMTALLDLESELHVTSYVLLETLALLQSRVGLGAACKFEHRFRPLLRVTWMTDDLHGRPPPARREVVAPERGSDLEFALGSIRAPQP